MKRDIKRSVGNFTKRVNNGGTTNYLLLATYWHHCVDTKFIKFISIKRGVIYFNTELDIEHRNV